MSMNMLSPDKIKAMKTSIGYLQSTACVGSIELRMYFNGWRSANAYGEIPTILLNWVSGWFWLMPICLIGTP
jgi:hypothetical protein